MNTCVAETSPCILYMREALRLGRRGRFVTAPNPCVGAVLVRREQIVGRGWHTAYGKPHAEVEAIADARQHGVNLAECTLYVTLEPCNHHGKTPPCTEAILEAGIRRVVIGVRDPNPVAAGGLEFLQSHGVTVETGICAQECLDLISDFLVWQQQSRAVCLLKLASTLDGRIATRTGHSQWISSPPAREYVHRLRSQVQAIMIGGQTFRVDNPLLTCRLEGHDMCCQPFAVVVTSSLPPPSSACQLLNARPSQTIFLTPESIATGHAATQLRECGATVWGLPLAPGSVGGLDLRAALTLLRTELGCHHVLCEGGGSLGRSLLEQGMADELLLFLAPKVLGDANAAPVLSGRAPQHMDEALALRYTDIRPVGPDLLITCKPVLPGTAAAPATDLDNS
ncbi:bifunctional diaminohydroxyphosphoribosylaminopyrimidine deaminase/5-amino-6-(5-phosphoribosylamino)uracil reductase RibD [Megalodesulfovibrio gigas]|uniref:Riboflavin biosynthesis protein RibD n=1 Tax=Megalodesulfovibrio gigas (strain ATCC 19364 / DSM 1382 / NCIMB 9332 / VKM B-1759) TaxID=1121448 RepID=T2GC48_MEGG1|nr:bifunctional diaminohydroxyphosphoribosylaminopyrimidine deaminase/5-amino-6-(5-phosphoribosylamino)uracil reductase RibD [Megalodesulfovibrio gigas]AGW13691.1 putative riboflavin biosynthesis protein RibD [Megalodesulfovibrio gigas DSM 1382 = ATCC 19364]